jgi:hypothetical protein
MTGRALISPTRRLARRGLSLVVAFALLTSGGCALGSGTLGGREKCWPESHQRAASIWRGTFRIDASGGWLDTPEGDVIALLPGSIAIRVGDSGVGELIRGDDVVARAGDDLTLFGGAGSDGTLVVCGIEEIRATS